MNTIAAGMYTMNEFQHWSRTALATVVPPNENLCHQNVFQISVPKLVVTVTKFNPVSLIDEFLHKLFLQRKFPDFSSVNLGRTI